MLIFNQNELIKIQQIHPYYKLCSSMPRLLQGFPAQCKQQWLSWVSFYVWIRPMFVFLSALQLLFEDDRHLVFITLLVHYYLSLQAGPGQSPNWLIPISIAPRTPISAAPEDVNAQELVRNSTRAPASNSSLSHSLEFPIVARCRSIWKVNQFFQ